MAAHEQAELSPAKESWDNPGPRLLAFIDERRRLIEAESRTDPGTPHQRFFRELLEEIEGG